MKTSIFAFVSFFVLTGSGTGQAPPRNPPKRPVLTFRAAPAKHLFSRGEDVVLYLSIRNESTERIFVSRMTQDEFVDFETKGPDGREMLWQGRGRIDSKAYSRSDFAVLRSGEEITAMRTISQKNGQGFVFSKPGSYSVTAKYSLGPPEYFASFAGETKVPSGSFPSKQNTFCIESCSTQSRN